MNVAREVILDLVPLYVAGEASPASRALVEAYLEEDPGLAERIRLLGSEGFVPQAPTTLAPELELRSLRRTRRLLGLQRWLFALGITLTSIAMCVEVGFQHGRVERFHFLLRDYPLALGPLLAVGVGCLLGYFALRRRLRTSSH